MPSSHPHRRFADIIYNIDAISRYTAGMDEAGFVSNDLVVDATERCLSRISEAAKKLGKLAEQLAANQPWPKIRDLGNHLRHEYDTIERPDLWRIVVDNLPSLHIVCEQAIKRVHEGLDREPPKTT